MVYFAEFLIVRALNNIIMRTIHTINELKTVLSAYREQGKNIGFVPTMGALHEGHLTLVKYSVQQNDVTVVSIFVNPTQFNDPKDLEKYPRTLEADSALLEKAGTSIVFVPSVAEMYPQPDTRRFSYPPLDTVMEGSFRPGHFNGVCQIVSKLFDAVEPDRAYFGEKDFQQLAIVRKMVSEMGYNIEIVGCPIVREPDGLAMSSRNSRLLPNERENALNISASLYKSVTFAKNNNVSDTRKFVENFISQADGLKLEYFSIVDADMLQEVESWDDAAEIIGCIAVFCGDVRLIDNVKYKSR